MKDQPRADKIRDLELQVRDFVNHPRWQYMLIQDMHRWNVICASLDLIGDTTLAIAAYRRRRDPKSIGDKYLLTYGLLQVLFVQQDAIEKLVKNLGLDYSRAPELVAIREVRNNTVGHPADRGGKTSHVISRPTLGKMGFTTLTYHNDGRIDSANIDLVRIVDTQETLVLRALTDAVRVLKDMEMQHRQQFKQRKLSAIFGPTIDYQLGKIMVGARHPGADLEYTLDNLTFVRTSIAKFTEAMRERGILGASAMITDEIAEADYAAAEIERMLRADASDSQGRDIYIYAFFLKHKIDELVRIAAEIDREYDSDEV